MLTASGRAPTHPPRIASALRLAGAQSDLLAGRIGRASTGFAEVLAELGGDPDAERATSGFEQPRTGAPVLRAAALAGLVEGMLARGDIQAAADAAARATAVAEAAGADRYCHAIATWIQGEVAAATGDAATAADLHLYAGRLLAGRDAPGEPALLPWRTGAALALTALGERAEAAALAEQHLSLAKAAGSPHATAQALRVLAATDVAGRREQLLRAARAALDGVTAARLAAQLDTDLAVLLLLGLAGGPDDRAGEAAVLLHGAERYAAAEGLRPLRSRVGRLLERDLAAGDVSGSPRVARLSAGQRRVARLAAQGLTNRDVAARLGVSVKAVEWQLSRVYRRLEITSRRDLLAALGTAP